MSELSLIYEQVLNGSEIFYHISPSKNRKNILKNGLMVNIGKNSLDAEETKYGVYLFPTYEDVEYALMNWDEMWDEDEPLDLWEVSLPNNFPMESDVGFEVRVLHNIPREYLKFKEEV